MWQWGSAVFLSVRVYATLKTRFTCVLAGRYVYRILMLVMMGPLRLFALQAKLVFKELHNVNMVKLNAQKGPTFTVPHESLQSRASDGPALSEHNRPAAEPSPAAAAQVFHNLTPILLLGGYCQVEYGYY